MESQQQSPPCPKALRFKEIMRYPLPEINDVLREIVDDWIGVSTKNGYRAARVQLINLILEACGMQFPIKDKNLKVWYPIREKYLDNRLKLEDIRCDILRLIDLKEVRDCESLHREFPNIKVVVQSFCDTLIRQSQNTPFFDDILKDFMDYMITLSCHLPVGYNKTVIWMTLQTITSLVRILSALRTEQIDNRLEDLEQKAIQFYQGFFLRFYKDKDQEIRDLCIWELTLWRTLYPSMFRANAYSDDLQACILAI